MNPDHHKILKQGVDTWNHWRGENPEVHADLFRADLREADLHGADLRGTNLSSANLSEANLRGAIGLTEDQLDSTEGDADTKQRTTRSRDTHGKA